MLLDVLISDGAELQNIKSDIYTDLRRLLNTRQGSLQHMSEYGLPDLQTIYQSFPSGKIMFIKKVQQLITCYEPRLGNIWVGEEVNNSPHCVLSLSIKASIIGKGNAYFKGYFYSEGYVQLSD